MRVGGNQASDGNIGGAFTGLIWNFPNATSLTFSYGGAFPGTVLAPTPPSRSLGPPHHRPDPRKSFTRATRHT